jgi:hypothetical protein
MSVNAMSTPGRMPAKNKLGSDAPENTAYMTIMMLGGIMGPIIAEVAVIAVLKPNGYPASLMALISIKPSPAASACAEPDMPEKIRLVKILTCARPPLKWPTRQFAKLKILVVMPLEFSRWPANIKKGTANMTKLSNPGAILPITSGKGLVPIKIRNKSELVMREKTTGISKNIKRNINASSNNSHIKLILLLSPHRYP